MNKPVSLNSGARLHDFGCCLFTWFLFWNMRIKNETSRWKSWRQSWRLRKPVMTLRSSKQSENLCFPVFVKVGPAIGEHAPFAMSIQIILTPSKPTWKSHKAPRMTQIFVHCFFYPLWDPIEPCFGPTKLKIGANWGTRSKFSKNPSSWDIRVLAMHCLWMIHGSLMHYPWLIHWYASNR